MSNIVRKNITLETDVFEKFSIYADKRGIKLSSWINTKMKEEFFQLQDTKQVKKGIKIELGVSQGGKAMVIQEDDEITGGFLHELQKLMIEYDVKSIENGIITISEDSDSIEIKDVVFDRVFSEKEGETSSFSIKDIKTPLTLEDIKENVQHF